MKELCANNYQPLCVTCEMKNDCPVLRPNGCIKPKVATLPEIANRVSITLEQIKLELSKDCVNKDLLYKMVCECKSSMIAVEGLMKWRENNDK